MIEEGLRTYLLADATISGLVSSRCYGVKLPQNPTLPALVITRVSGPRTYNTAGQNDVTRGRFQIDTWADDLSGARELGEAVRSRITGYKGTLGNGESSEAIFLDNSTDLYDPETDTHRVSMDYIVWYKE